MNREVLSWLIIPSIFVGLLLALMLAARRYASRQRRLGRWDKYGPLVETERPPKGVWGGGMSERLEVIGKWRGKVLRRRQPNEEP
jgi:hypothetical protein